MSERTVHLQWIGRVKSKAASAFVVGDWMAWNGGVSTEVLGVREASPAFLMFTFRNSKGDGTHERRIKKDRQCAIGSAPLGLRRMMAKAQAEAAADSLAADPSEHAAAMRGA